jgi:hypothetical protein
MNEQTHTYVRFEAFAAVKTTTVVGFVAVSTPLTTGLASADDCTRRQDPEERHQTPALCVFFGNLSVGQRVQVPNPERRCFVAAFCLGAVFL